MILLIYMIVLLSSIDGAATITNGTLNISTTQNPATSTIATQTATSATSVNVTANADTTISEVTHKPKEYCVVLDITLRNCSCNQKDACKIDAKNREIFSILYSSVTVFCCFIGIVGNVAVLIIAGKRHKNLSHNNIILAELAAVDFFLCIVFCIDRVRIFWYDGWPYGAIVCKMIKGFTLLGEMIIGGLILLLAIERFLGIIHPIQCRRIKAKLTRILFPVNVLAAIAVAVPAVIGYNLNSKSRNCEYKWYLGRTSALVYTWFQFGFYYVLSIFVALVLVSIILRFLRRQSWIYQSSKMKDIRQRRIRDNYRMIYILISIALAYVFCVYPLRIMRVYLEASNNDAYNLNCYWILVYIAYVINPFHIMLNPIFYCIIDRNWRDEVLDLFHLRCRRSGSSDDRGSFQMIGRLSSIVDNGR